MHEFCKLWQWSWSIYTTIIHDFERMTWKVFSFLSFKKHLMMESKQGRKICFLKSDDHFAQLQFNCFKSSVGLTMGFFWKVAIIGHDDDCWSSSTLFLLSVLFCYIFHEYTQGNIVWGSCSHIESSDFLVRLLSPLFNNPKKQSRRVQISGSLCAISNKRNSAYNNFLIVF